MIVKTLHRINLSALLAMASLAGFSCHSLALSLTGGKQNLAWLQELNVAALANTCDTLFLDPGPPPLPYR